MTGPGVPIPASASAAGERWTPHTRGGFGASQTDSGTPAPKSGGPVRRQGCGQPRINPNPPGQRPNRAGAEVRRLTRRGEGSGSPARQSLPVALVCDASMFAVRGRTSPPVKALGGDRGVAWRESGNTWHCSAARSDTVRRQEHSGGGPIEKECR
ncbi:hypothetical protein GCM10022222_48210 [Amycolatopsis ultiminotia]|uniref:Uncharacterized protein n=1 Tax=Amycolatopsis ultiminotia TaxID=543629 RepID=A0ABP6X1L3_9PSEU